MNRSLSAARQSAVTASRAVQFAHGRSFNLMATRSKSPGDSSAAPGFEAKLWLRADTFSRDLDPSLRADSIDLP